MRRVSGLRWLMVGLIFLATVINYVDRQTVSVLKKSISDDLGLSNPEYAAIQNAFLIAYAVSQMLSGRLYDLVGTRLGFTISIVVWSIAAVAHAAARSMTSFAFWRFVLGAVAIGQYSLRFRFLSIRIIRGSSRGKRNRAIAAPRPSAPAWIPTW